MSPSLNRLPDDPRWNISLHHFLFPSYPLLFYFFLLVLITLDITSLFICFLLFLLEWQSLWLQYHLSPGVEVSGISKILNIHLLNERILGKTWQIYFYESHSKHWSNTFYEQDITLKTLSILTHFILPIFADVKTEAGRGQVTWQTHTTSSIRTGLNLDNVAPEADTHPRLSSHCIFIFFMLTEGCWKLLYTIVCY